MQNNIHHNIYSFIVMLSIFLGGCWNTDQKEFQGYVEADPIYISSPYSGNLVKLLVQRGEVIQRDELLFILDREPQYSQWLQAKNELRQAQANLENLKKGERETVIEQIQAQIKAAQTTLKLAKLRLARYQYLYETKAIGKDTLDAVQTDYNTKLQDLKRLQANLAEAQSGARVDLIKAQEALVYTSQAKVTELQWTLDQKKINAPIDGYIYDTYFREGEFVPQAQPVLAMLARKYFYFTFFVPLTLLNKIVIGDKVSVSLDGSKKTYEATIVYIYPKVEFAPPVIYSRNSNYKYVFRIRAQPKLEEAFEFHPGQPVYIRLLDRVSKS